MSKEFYKSLESYSYSTSSYNCPHISYINLILIFKVQASGQEIANEPNTYNFNLEGQSLTDKWKVIISNLSIA